MQLYSILVLAFLLFIMTTNSLTLSLTNLFFIDIDPIGFYNIL